MSGVSETHLSFSQNCLCRLLKNNFVAIFYNPLENFPAHWYTQCVWEYRQRGLCLAPTGAFSHSPSHGKDVTDVPSATFLLVDVQVRARVPCPRLAQDMVWRSGFWIGDSDLQLL
jgi:hypothetical protein